MGELPRKRNEKKRYHHRRVRPYRGVPLTMNDGRPSLESCDDELAGLTYDQRMMQIALGGRTSPLSQYDSYEDGDEYDLDFDDSEMDFE